MDNNLMMDIFVSIPYRHSKNGGMALLWTQMKL